jgi:hypothetical protein
MGIDGIGKAPPIAPPGGTGQSSASGGDFRVGQSAAPIGSADLARLERGEITLDQYLDTKVAQATRHLDGRMTTAQIDLVRETLRAELTSDPVLVELVRRTTGKSPESSAT